MAQWYEELFQNYAAAYEQEPYIKGTLGEVDFIEQELGYDKTAKILDIGCGTGRHSIELAKRGYTVTGVDLSEAQLAKARINAKAAGVEVPFMVADARALKFDREFDCVVMICEGGFALMETDEMNYDILKGAAAALKKNGKFIFTTLNGLFPLFHSVKDFINSHDKEDRTQGNSFDLLTFRDHSQFDFTDDAGVKHSLTCNERFYVPPEITWQLKSLGFINIAILGCQMGTWTRERALTPDDFEMLVIAEQR